MNSTTTALHANSRRRAATGIDSNNPQNIPSRATELLFMIVLGLFFTNIVQVSWPRARPHIRLAWQHVVYDLQTQLFQHSATIAKFL